MRHEHNLATGKSVDLEDAPVLPLTAEQIKEGIKHEITMLESSVTPRNYREFVMGNQYSIDKINKVEADIAILRAKL